MKKFKTKHRPNYRLLILPIIMLILAIFLLFWLSSSNLKNSHSHLIEYLCMDLKMVKDEKPNIFNYLMGNLDILISNYMFINDKTETKVEVTNKVFIYNTHDAEKYQDASVLDASMMLSASLLKYNILNDVSIDRVSDTKNKDSYKVSRSILEKAILKDNSYTFFLDIHRDSVSSKYTKASINNKNYAKIMFVLGLENKNYQENEKVMQKLNDYLNKNYPGLSRGIYKKQGSGVNGVYNQDFHPNTLLVEIGGVDNTKEEVQNSTAVLALALYDCYGDILAKKY